MVTIRKIKDQRLLLCTWTSLGYTNPNAKAQTRQEMRAPTSSCGLLTMAAMVITSVSLDNKSLTNAVKPMHIATTVKQLRRLYEGSLAHALKWTTSAISAIKGRLARTRVYSVKEIRYQRSFSAIEPKKWRQHSAQSTVTSRRRKATAKSLPTSAPVASTSCQSPKVAVVACSAMNTKQS